MKVTDAPLHCAACYQQEPGIHIDFEAAFDGPVLNREDVIATGIATVAIDDLVLCERCIKAAAKRCGLVHAPDLVAERDKALGRIAELEADARKDKHAIRDLAEANAAMAERVGGHPHKVVQAARELAEDRAAA